MAVIDIVIPYATVMNSPYIPPEIVKNHCVVSAVNQPAHATLTARLGGGDSDIRRGLAQHLAGQIAPRLKIRTEERDYGDTYMHAAELFVFTREELAAILERHYIVMEPLPPIP